VISEMADSELTRVDSAHVEPSESMAPRDPTPGVLERQVGKRHSGYGGLAHGDHTSRNPSKQGSGGVVRPMYPGVNSG
jgi:hypothetical protein